MMLTPAIVMARETAGYRPPATPKICCANCGASCKEHACAHYYCRRHRFYVHSRGVCPKFSTEPFVAPEPKKPPFTQEELFK